MLSLTNFGIKLLSWCGPAYADVLHFCITKVVYKLQVSLMSTSFGVHTSGYTVF